MRKIFFISTFGIIFATVSGCASISEEQCRLGDWYQIGLADGQQGKTHQAANYTQDCAEYAVSVDLAQYNQGRLAGLQSYCTYDNGVQVGQARQRYANVCPADLSDEFLLGYRANYDLASALAEQREHEDDIAQLLQDLGAESVTDSDKKRLKSQLKSAKFELERSDYEVRRALKSLAISQITREK